MEELTQIEKTKVLTIPKADFEAIGHKQDDFEMNYEEFKAHEIEINKYLEANKK